MVGFDINTVRPSCSTTRESYLVNYEEYEINSLSGNLTQIYDVANIKAYHLIWSSTISFQFIFLRI
jgi:hypothetical protein